MVVTIPSEVINGAWGVLLTLLGVAGAILTSIKTRFISVGRKHRAMDDYLSIEEFDGKLHLHCSKRQQDLTVTLQAMQDKNTENFGKIMTSIGDIRERVSRIEGAFGATFGADHK